MVTVEELMVLCADEVKKGNGFHQLFYTFQSEDVTTQYGYDAKKQILLG